MKKTRNPIYVATLALVTSFAAMPVAHAQGARPASYVPGRILVMPRAGLPDAALERILQENGGGKARRVGPTELRIVDMQPGQESRLIERLSRHPHIKFAELDRLVVPDLVANDPYLGSEWHIGKIGADTAWDSAQGSGVVIAILDTGTDCAHPDLSCVGGWNIYDNNSNTADVYGHGTKTAGAAAGVMNDGIGVAGVAGGARIMPIRISGTDGSASLSAMAQGLTWAADHGARVANISFVCADSSAVLSAASYMKSKGGLVTSSAGNYGVEETFATSTAMIPVSATDSSDNLASWSSYGGYVAMSAPGVGIYTTTMGGGYGAVSGTSFSSPVTAGAVALIMSANPRLSSSDVEKILFSTATDLGTAGRDKWYGYGRVNAAAAVQAALSSTSASDTAAPSVSIAAPGASSTVSGLVPVDVSASDNVGVVKVELRVNGSLIATDVASPYAYSWDTSKAPNGTAQVIATAYDAAGNAGTSATVTVNVSNSTSTPTPPPTPAPTPPMSDTIAPTVAINSPTNGSTLTGRVAVNVSATDNNGATALRQALYIDGKLVTTATGGALTFSWNTRKQSPGSHTVQAVVTDAAGNSTTQSVQVIVSK